MKAEHTSQEFEKRESWKSIGRGIQDLHSNGDIEGLTAMPETVGYLGQAFRGGRPAGFPGGADGFRAGEIGLISVTVRVAASGS